MKKLLLISLLLLKQEAAPPKVIELPKDETRLEIEVRALKISNTNLQINALLKSREEFGSELANLVAQEKERLKLDERYEFNYNDLNFQLKPQ